MPKKILPASKTILFESKKILFTAKTTGFPSKTILFALKAGDFASKTILFAPKAIFFASKTILFAPKPIFFIPKTIFIAPKTILFAAKTTGFSSKTILFAAKTTGFSSKTILFAPKAIFFASKTISFAPKTIFFISKTIFFASENLGPAIVKASLIGISCSENGSLLIRSWFFLELQPARINNNRGNSPADSTYLQDYIIHVYQISCQAFFIHRPLQEDRKTAPMPVAASRFSQPPEIILKDHGHLHLLISNASDHNVTLWN